MGADQQGWLRDNGPPDYLPIAPPPFLNIQDEELLLSTLKLARCLERNEDGELLYPLSLFFPLDANQQPRKNCIDERHGVAVCKGGINPNTGQVIADGIPCKLINRCGAWAREHKVAFGTWGGEQEWTRRPRRASGARKKT